MLDDFNPRDHWREFEKFALRIVELKVDEAIVYDKLHAWRTKDTADQGVDGNILVSAASGKIHITVEAKLRKTGKIALADIASSIVNYLVNFSDMHFVVTNVRYTQDASRIADSINSRRMFSLNYLDCISLRKCIEQHPELTSLYPILTGNICEQCLFDVPEDQKEQQPTPDDRIPIVSYWTASRDMACDELQNAIRNKVPLIVLSGPRGTDKSLVLDRCMKKLCTEKVIVHIDLHYICSIQTFLLAFLKDLLGLDVFEVLNLLDEEKCGTLFDEIDTSDGQRVHIVEVLRELIAYHNSSRNPKMQNYLIREYLAELAGLNKTHRILILENVNFASEETLNSIMDLLPQIADMNFSIILELGLFVPSCNQYLTNKYWFDLTRQVSEVRILGRLTKSIHLDEYTNEEAAQIVQAITDQPAEGYFVKQFIRRFGKNPALIREIAWGVKEKHITTANELWDFAIPGSTNELQDTLFAELYKTQVRNHLAYQSIRWCLQTVDILNGYISIPLIASIENHFQTYGMAQILKNTGLLQVGQNGWSIRNETAETVLHETVQYWPTEELIKFLLQNETIWNLPTLQEKCAKVDMLISLKDESAFCVADSTVKRCEEDGEDRLAERVLRKCRDATQYAISPKLRFRHLCFAYRCLEKSNLLETLPVENRENECTKILFECKLLYENSPTDQTAELLILCNLMKNAMAQNKFHFSEGEPNIDISIKLAIKHNLSKLGALAYVKKAIYTKELYGHQRCFEVFREGIRKYPQDNYLLACYLANYAAYQAKTSLASAIQTASAALHAAHKSDDSELCCWIGADLFMYRLQNGENTNELLSEIKACRQTADQHGYRPDISRTYNLEGVFYQINRNNNLAVKCFRNSIQCFDGTVTDQQKFLFRCNLLSALPTDEEEFKSVFQQQMCWLESNKEWLLKKLQLRSKLSEESNFAALICILDVAQRQRMRNEFDRIKTWFPLETLQNIEYKQRIKLCNLLSGRFTLTTKRVSILF